jgi:integrase
MPKRKNKDIKVYKLKNGQKRYMFKIYLGLNSSGKKTETTRRGFKSYEDANAVYKELANTRADNYIKQKQVTFDQLYEMWLPFYSKDVKESTLWKTETLYKHHLKEHFGNKYVDQITTEDIAEYFLDLSSKFVRYKSVFFYLRRILEYAIDINLLDRNPARISLLPKKGKKGRDTSDNFYSSNEVKEFLATAKEYNERAYVYFLILATTGMRKSEAIALDWNDIEWDKGRIFVQRTTAYGEDNKYITQLPKGNKKRYVPLDDRLAVALKHYRKDLSPKLFHTARGDHYLRSNEADKWKKAIYEKNSDLKEITVHGLRHTFTTLLIHSGINVKDIQAILGHTDARMTLDVYAHSTAEGREQVKAEISKLF